MMKIGDTVRLVYDGYPLKLTKDYGYGKIIKITPTGLLRIVGCTKDAVTNKQTDRNELFSPHSHYAKGWNTLWFEEVTDGEDDKE